MMSTIHQTETGIIISDPNKSLTFDLHRVASQSIVSNKIADLLSRTTASQAIIYHESSATSQATNTQSTEVSPQESSLSSQEMILDSKDQVPPTKELKGDAVTNSESADRVDKQSDSINGRQQISDSIKYSGKVTTTTQSPPLGFGSTYKTDSAAGQKRMANGEIKPSNSTSPVDQLRSEFSPMSSSSPRKSPQRSPQIGQLTAKLRTRLTYAMVKVHNGWESKTINEVETLAAQRMSPGISTSHGRSLSDSPQTKTVGSSNRINRHVMFSPDVIPGGKRSPDSLTSSSEASEAGNWRYENSPRGSKKPSLAPPVDLGPRNPRRSNPPTFFPPSIDLRSGSNVSAISISSIPPRVNVTPPSTYRPIGISRLSQKPSSAMEQDAIETLLFMSSPGNTQYRSNHQPTPTSLYPGIIPSQPRKNNLSVPSVLTKVPNTDSIPVSPRKKMIPDGLDLGIDHNIDKMLDQMSSGSEGEVTSSEEDEN